MNEKLFRVLRHWREQLLVRSLPAPPEADLRAISMKDFDWTRADVEPVTSGWRANIDELKLQVRFGVVDPVAQADSTIWVPRPGLPSDATPAASTQSSDPVPPGPAAPPRERDVFAELQKWANQKRKFARPGDPILRLQKHRLRALAAPGANVAQIIESNSLQSYEADILDVLRRRSVQAPAGPPERRTERPPAAPPRTASAPAEPPTPVPPPPAPASVGQPFRGPETQFDPAGFAHHDWSGRDIEPVSLRAAVVPDKGIALSWARRGDDREPIQIFRVVAGDGKRPHQPEGGRLVAATTDTEAEDREPFTASVRYVSVWCNSGPSERAAMQNQPYRHAEATVVAPVADVEIGEDGGTVIGTWRVNVGAVRVQVYRIPIDKIGPGIASHMYRILSDEDNLLGFEDTEATRGGHFVYQAVVDVVDQDGTVHFSAPVNREHQVSVVLAPVNDLEVTITGNSAEPRFDVSWTPPQFGDVDVYRSEREPGVGIQDGPVEIARLEGARLMDKDLLPSIVRAMPGGRVGMARVSWPADTTRAYFTPVTHSQGMAYVGATFAATRVLPVADPVVRERVNEQLLTFSWPRGAAAVWIFIAARGTTPSPPLQIERRADFEFNAQMWKDDGALHFVPPLPLDGCDLHMYSVAFQGGTAYLSEPTTYSYAGLRRIRYSLAVKRAVMTSRPSSASLKIRSDSYANLPLNFALIANPDRFPLHKDDGQVLPLTESIEGAATTHVIQPELTDAWTEPGWTVDLSSCDTSDERPYYVRLFAIIPAHLVNDLRLSQIAVLDPPMSELRLRRRSG